MTAAPKGMRLPVESAADSRERRLLGSHGRYYLLVAPAALVFIGFVAWPITSVMVASITVQDTASMGDDIFMNYRAVVGDPVFWTAIRNMVIWAILTIGIQMLVGGTLAYLIETHARRAKTILRTAFLIPMVTSASVVAIVWAQFYAPGYGPLAELLKQVHLSFSSSMLGDPKTAIYAVIIINIWMYTGFSMLLYIVGLHRIPSEIMDAAKADGATGWRLARHVLVPMLAPTTKSLLLLGIIGTLQTFALVYLTTGGGPAHFSEVLGTHIFRTYFFLDQDGYAAALSVMTLLIAFVATIIQMRFLRSGLGPTGTAK
jgi:raffinose/stachyose/melibiose transport system permease protein